MISFTISGNIPANATITNVQLTLTVGQVPNPGFNGNSTISLYDVTQSWPQGTTGSASAGIAATGQGFAANPGDATWNDVSYSATLPTLWTTAGGDHSGTASASLSLSNFNLTGNPSFTWSSAQLVADVQNWLANPSSNFGWELINSNETTASTLFGFYSSEWDNAHFGGSSTQVPVLQVTYTTPIPEPGAGSLCAMAALVALGLRPRPRRGAPRGSGVPWLG